MCKPFVKWVGGKTQLLNELKNKYPINFKKYCEPFVGGGAVFFDILDNYNFESILINDLNKVLINSYINIRDNIDGLIKNLKLIEKEYNSINELSRENIYYKYRDEYNSLLKENKYNLRSSILFIFLNKTCFNGLYRVNSKGIFNVPKGIYKKPQICDEENLLDINKKIQNVEIRCGDYENVYDFIDEDTFVYIDPPYRPLNNTSSFTSYNMQIFDDNEQIRLRDFVNRINNKNAKIILSNSDPKNSNINDNFFDNIYINYNIGRVSAKRCINSNAKNRGKINELIISNY